MEVNIVARTEPIAIPAVLVSHSNWHSFRPQVCGRGTYPGRVEPERIV